jgi:hypothetical protein
MEQDIMKKESSRKLLLYRTFSILTILLGLILMLYMIIVEDEPGALPLLLIIIGTAWFSIIQIRNKNPR